ncbi:MAG: hypothetical protein HY290_03750 [Planctomycetia bacterium]|nr:hypothetical protein [Planctomycetia bacterium]
MPRKSPTTLIACTMLALAIAGGCQQRLTGGSGVGGNLVRVKGDPVDGTAIYVPIDQVEKYRQAEKEKSGASSDLKE